MRWSKQLWLLLFLFVTVPLVLLGLWHQDTGYANNGDFARSAGFLLDHPQGFSALYVPDGHPDRARMFFNAWLDQWVVSNDGPEFRRIGEAPVYKLYLTLQVWLTSWVQAGVELYSITKGAWLSRCILYSALVVALWLFSGRLPVSILWMLVTAMAWLFLESSWIAYLNSFYEEQIAVVLLPLLALALAKYASDRVRQWGWIVMILALVVGWSKTAYFYAPTLGAVMLAWIGVKSGRRLFLLWLVFQLIALHPVVAGKYKRVNPYHSVYFGALTTLAPHELKAVGSIGGKPLYSECIDVAVFFAEGENCLQKTRVGRLDVLHVIAQQPRVLPRMFERAMRDGRETDLTYLGKAKDGGSTKAFLPVFNGWRKLFQHGAQYVALALALSGVVLMLVLGVQRSPPLLVAGVFVLMFGWSQYFAALGDGFYELTKHLSIGNYALALGSIFTVTGLCALLMATWEKSSE